MSKFTKRKKRTVDELKDASEHLHYEVSQLYATIPLIMYERKNHSRELSNILIESYTIRVRILIDFLFGEEYARKNVKEKNEKTKVKMNANDILAEDYFEDSTE